MSLIDELEDRIVKVRNEKSSLAHKVKAGQITDRQADNAYDRCEREVRDCRIALSALYQHHA